MDRPWTTRLDKVAGAAGDVEQLEDLEQRLDKLLELGQAVAGEPFSPCTVRFLI